MNLRDMQLFVTAVEQGSILGAARLENISQPALTRRLQNLEDDLRMRLLDRSSRGVRLTDEGTIIYERACALVNEARRLRNDARSLRDGGIGRLAVGVGIGCEAMFARALTDFSKQRNEIDLTVQVDFFSSLVSQMRSGRLDVALAIDPMTGPVPDFQTSYIGELVSGLACRSDHPLAAHGEVATADLANARWAVWDSPNAARFLQGFFIRHGMGSPTIAMRTNSGSVMRAAVLDAGVLAIMPEHMVRDDVASGRIAMLQSALGVYVNRLVLVHPSPLQMRGAVQAFIRAIHETGRSFGPAAT